MIQLLGYHRHRRTAGGGASAPEPDGDGVVVDPSFPRIAARWSDVVNDTLGANTHMTYGPSTTYIYRQGGPNHASGVDAVRWALQYVGIRHIRETLGIGAQMRTALGALDDLVDFTFAGTYINAANRPTAAQVAAEILDHYADTCIGVSGFNEPDLKRNSISDWVSQTVDFQQDLWAALSSSDVAVLTPPMAGRTYTYLGNLAAYCDVNDLHIYPGGAKPSTDIAFHVNGSQAVAPGKPVWVTECGYENALAYRGGNPPVPEDVAGVYAPRLLLEHVNRGTKHAFVYELGDSRRNDALDNREDHFGLFAYDTQPTPSWRAKPAATALRNLLLLTADPGAAYDPQPLPVRITGGDTLLRHMVLGRRDGTHLVVLWRDVSIWNQSTTSTGTRATVADQSVQVEFGRAYRVTRYAPSKSAAGTALGVVQSSTVALGADAVVLQVEVPPQ